MDGTRDRPPGKSAENWSRKDGIRAGAVTGPWRSAPRDPRAPSVAPRQAPPAAAPAGGGPEEAAARRAPAGGRKAGIWGWIAAGALAAVAIAALAVIFRPVPEAPAEATAGAPAAVAEADPAPVPADPALRGVSVVRLRVGPDFPAERQAAILAALGAAGITAVRVEALPFEIASSRVGYYRAADLAAAEALGRVVAPVIAEGGEVGVRDYGELLDDAEPGRLDLWVGG